MPASKYSIKKGTETKLVPFKAWNVSMHYLEIEALPLVKKSASKTNRKGTGAK